MLHVSVTLTEDPEIAMRHSKGEKLSEIIGWILQFEKKPKTNAAQKSLFLSPL